MSTKVELEKSALFRLGKVFGAVFFSLIFICTGLVWYLSISTNFDASKAYYVCGLASYNPHQLTVSEQQELETYKETVFTADSSSEAALNEQCYVDYSGIKDPLSATKADIEAFRKSQTESNGRVYSVQGITENQDWHWTPFLVALLVELIIYLLLEKIVLYIVGGKEALE